MTITVRVQEADFDPGAELARLAAGRPGIGGVGCFIGLVRGEEGAREVRALALEHYPGMTERAIARIAEEAVRRWDLLGCTVIHRHGRLAVGENIVLVLAAAPHRRAALAATEYLIDWLKTRAPFWKREEYANGESAWVEARAEDDAAAARWD